MNKFFRLCVVALLSVPCIVFAEEERQRKGFVCVEGNCKNGTGKEIQIWDESPTGAYYVGEFKNGLRHGKGKAVHMPSLKGCPENNCPDSFNGEWKKDEWDGFGIATYPETNADRSAIYIGQVKDSYPHGYGEFRYSNGRIYEGQFSNGERNEKEFRIAMIYKIEEDGTETENFNITFAETYGHPSYNAALIGKYKIVWVSGIVLYCEYDSNGIRNGKAVRINGETKTEFMFVNGYMQGEFKVYLSDKLVMKGIYKNSEIIKGK